MKQNGVVRTLAIAFLALGCVLMLQVAGRARGTSASADFKEDSEPAPQTDYPYTVTDLGTLGGMFSLATGVNPLGQVVGVSLNGAGIERAFLWLPSSAYGLPAGINDLGTPGTDRSGAEAITADGRVSGYRYIGASYRAYVHNLTTGTTLDLNTLGGSNAEGTDISDAGPVVGSSYLAGNTTNHAVIWEDFNDDGVIDSFDVGTLGGTHSRALAVNDSSEVAGWAYTGDDVNFHAIRFNDANENRVSDPGEMIDLGALGGPYSQATDIATTGAVAGWADTTAGGDSHAFLWVDTNGNGVSDPGEMIDLGTLGGRSSSALAISPDGTKVAGWANPTGSGRRLAFLWSVDTGMVDLNTLIDPASGWILEEASAINGSGQIVGSGWHNDKFRAFLLTPVATGPELENFTLKPTIVTGGCKTVTGIALLNAPAPPGGAEVDISYNSTAHGPASVTIPQGKISKSFKISTGPVNEVTTGDITATYDGFSRSATLTVRPISVQSLTLNPKIVVGPDPSTGTVKLECAVPEEIGSITVNLTSNKPSTAFPLASSLYFNTGESLKTFGIQTNSVESKTVAVVFTATANDGSKKATLKVLKAP